MRPFVIILFLCLLFPEKGDSIGKIPKELQSVLRKYPTINEFLINSSFDKAISSAKNLALYRFIDNSANEFVYIAWSRSHIEQKIEGLDGFFWVFDTSQVNLKMPVNAPDISLSVTPVFLLPAAYNSPVIDSVYVDGPPVEPVASDGDLWLSTWADDNNVYSGWGDGKGILDGGEDIPWVDCGVARLSGCFPYINAKVMYREDLTPPLEKNDKPSSFIYLDSCLYGQFHSPLGDARIGYLSRSADYGISWERIGFFQKGEKKTSNASPWTRTNNSPFRCLFFINMGKNYNLNADGYVYALGIGKEWHWMSLRVYLTRVRRENIAVYNSYEYFTGQNSMNQPTWSENQYDAVPLHGLMTMGQGSAIYHPEIKRFLFLTDKDIFDAPKPWGPWTYAGSWTNWMNRPGKKEWQGGYQPGIISKDTGPDSFWFTVSGQNKKPYMTYKLNIGRMILVLHEKTEN